MSVLPDVNLLLAYGWKTHAEHARTRSWFHGLSFLTCPITELGFPRVSMSPAYRADFKSSMIVLQAIRNLSGASFIADDAPAESLPAITSYKEATDAYLVALAATNQAQLATLDLRLISATWASGIAYHPFTP